MTEFRARWGHAALVTLVGLTVMLGGCSRTDSPSGDTPGKAPGGAAPPASASAGPPPCPPEAPVKIDNIVIASSAASAATLTVDPDPRKISRNAGGVRWTIKSPQGKVYVFTGDGISFKPNAPVGPASSPTTGSLTEFVWCFNATPPDQTWAYTIKFVDVLLPSKVWRCDPIIVNSADGVAAEVSAPVTVNCTLQ